MYLYCTPHHALEGVGISLAEFLSSALFIFRTRWSILRPKRVNWVLKEARRPTLSIVLVRFAFSQFIRTRPSALGTSDPFCGPSNPWHLFTKDYTIFCGPSNPQYLFPKDYAIFFWQIIDINKKFCTVSINFLLQLFKLFSFLG